jgi:hypothetical protein
LVPQATTSQADFDSSIHMATEVFVTTDFAPISSNVQLEGILKYSGISLVLPVWFGFCLKLNHILLKG